MSKQGRLFNILKNIPNFLTILRIFISGWIVKIGIQKEDDPVFLLILALGAGASDALDGWIARKKHWQSKFGAALDPAADKLFIASMIFVFAMLGYWPAANASKAVLALKLFIILFGITEAALITFFIIGFFKKISVSASKWGKWQMKFFCTVAYVWIVYFVFERSGSGQIPIFVILLEDLLLAITICCASFSLDDYWDRYKIFNERRKKAAA